MCSHNLIAINMDSPFSWTPSCQAHPLLRVDEYDCVVFRTSRSRWYSHSALSNASSCHPIGSCNEKLNCIPPMEIPKHATSRENFMPPIRLNFYLFIRKTKMENYTLHCLEWKISPHTSFLRWESPN